MSMDIKSSDLVTLFEKALSDIPEPKLVDVGVVVQVGDGICRVHGLTDAVFNELVVFEGGGQQGNYHGFRSGLCDGLFTLCAYPCC